MEPCGSNNIRSEAVYSHLPCFFCNGLTDNPKSSNVIKVSIHNLFNYLQIHSPNDNNSDSHNQSQEMSSILSICTRCSQMAEEFNELHDLMETTRRLLNRCLARILELMTKSELAAPKDKEEEDEDGDLRTAMMGRIREVSKLCLTKITGKTSSVVLDDLPSTSTAKDSNGPSQATNGTEVPSSTRFDSETDDDDGDKIECNGNGIQPVPLELESEAESELEQVKIISRRKKKKKAKKKKTQPTSSTTTTFKKSGTCRFCKKTFTRFSDMKRHVKNSCKVKKASPPIAARSVFTCAYCSYEGAKRREHMKKHLILCHPEMFFHSERNNSSSWKEENLKEIVKKIVFPKFTKREENSPSCSCSVCGRKYDKGKSFSQNRSELKVHLVNYHIQEVKECLKEIMEEPDAYLEEQLHKVSASSGRNQKEESNVCNGEDENEIPISLLYGFSMWDTLMDLDVDESCSVLPNEVNPSPMD